MLFERCENINKYKIPWQELEGIDISEILIGLYSWEKIQKYKKIKTERPQYILFFRAILLTSFYLNNLKLGIVI